MDQLSQRCQYKKHQDYEVQYVCLDVNCEHRLFCSKCMLDNRHNHGHGDKENILDHESLQTYIQHQLEQLHLKVGQISFFIQCYSNYIKTIQLSISTLLDKLKELQSYNQIKDKISHLKNSLDNLRNTKLNQIDDQFISELIKFEYCSYRQSLLQEINQQCNILMQSSISMQKFSTKQVQLWELADIQFEMSILDQKADQKLYSSSISNNLRYIISSRNDSLLKIRNYQDYQLIREYNLHDRVQISKFTDDSSLLYLGTAQGILQCYDVQNNFKQTYKQKIHLINILNLYCITNYIILTSSFDKQIIKTNTELNQQLFAIEAHNDRIDGIDYNRSQDVIASCSNNQIKIWNNKNGLLIIQHQNSNKSILNQVLFIHNDQLISLDSEANIIIWQIKYESKDLIKIHTLQGKNKVFNISLALNQQVIILICKDYIKFYTVQGQYISSILHNVKKFYMIRQTQLESMKSIIIQGKKQLKILKMKI